jgi:hypothetical protein
MRATGQYVPVLIIGAGPAGLSLGAELKDRGIEFLIVDKGNVGDSWERMPPHLKLVSPWKCNWLAWADRKRFKANAQLTREELVDYLRDYATTRALPVAENCEVLSVEREREGFRVRTSRGWFQARIVACATGYFSNPVRPSIENTAVTSIPQMHYADYRGAEQLRSIIPPKGLVLLVGKRLSAGQTMLELVDAGYRVAISHQSPINFGVNDWLWPLVYRAFSYAEALKLKVLSGAAGTLDVRMPGGRAQELVRSGAVQTFPAISRFECDSVVFEDGRRLQPSLVFYATGFKPALQCIAQLDLPVCAETGVPLARNMESLTMPNLFFLGFEMLRNFQSRFLRGIRNDAIVLADQIERRLAEKIDDGGSSLPLPRKDSLSVTTRIHRGASALETNARGFTSVSVEAAGKTRSRIARLLSLCRRVLYYVRVPITWTALTVHNSWGILNVLDLIWLRPMRGGLIDEQHPFCTGIDSATGQFVWLRNVIFKTPRREHWPNNTFAPESDDEIIRKVGDHLRKQVLMAARSETHPNGHAAPMPPGILYIHGGVHFNGVWLLFNDFAEAIRHFSDPKFAAEFSRMVRREKREPVTLFRDRDYDRTEFARFVCFMRTTFPWFSNCNGPKKFVLWGNPSPYPAVNTITGNWIRETRALKSEQGRATVARPPVAGKYFQNGPYYGERETTRWPENLLAFLTNKRIALRGERENLYFVDKRKLKRGLRFGPDPIPTPFQRLRRWIGERTAVGNSAAADTLKP